MRHSYFNWSMWKSSELFRTLKSVCVCVSGKGLFPSSFSSNQAGNPYGCSEAIKLSVAWHFWCSQSSASMRLMLIEKCCVYSVHCVCVCAVWMCIKCEHFYTHGKFVAANSNLFCNDDGVVIVVWHVGRIMTLYRWVGSILGLVLFLKSIFKNECSILTAIIENYGENFCCSRDFQDWSSDFDCCFVDWFPINCCQYPWLGLSQTKCKRKW